LIEAHINLGVAYYQTGQISSAVTHFALLWNSILSTESLATTLAAR
jgi:hypothetical protein